MEDIFNCREKGNQLASFMYYALWTTTILLLIAPIVTIARMDLGYIPMEAEKQLAGMCLGLGGAIFLYRIFIIAFNDLTNNHFSSKSNIKKEGHREDG